MDLLLGQLVYTSFAGIGFKALASAKVPRAIQQSFLQRVVFQHWDVYHVPKVGYRAAYLHQLTLEHSLFGWLYNDGADDMDRSHVPYFICYYMAEPLYPFQLKNIFTCLQNGPVALIDRHIVPSSLETKILPDLWSYQPARAGVAIPEDVRKRKLISFKQGELLDLFVSVEEQDLVVDLNEQTYEQQKDSLSIYTRYIIDGIDTGAGVVDVDAAVIKNIEPIETRIQEQITPGRPLKKVTGAIKNRELTPLKASNTAAVDQAIIRSLLPKNVLPQIPVTLPINIHLEKKTDYNSVLAYRNSQLLLRAGIAAAAVALTISIHGLLQTTIFAPNDPKFTNATSSPVSSKTLAEVPNVPQGLFKYGGSTTFAPLRSIPIVAALNKAHPQFQLRFAEPIGGKPGSGTGIKMLLAGEMSFAQSSRPPKSSEFGEAKKRGFTLETIPVAIDGVAFYVSPQVSIPGLSLSQVRGIFTGKITNWKAIGGPNLRITPFSRNLQASGTVDFLKEKVLLGEKFSATVQEVETTTESIQKVGNTPGGIGYATASEVGDQNAINSLPLSNIHSLPLSKGTGQAFVSPFQNANDAEVNETAFTRGSYPLTRQLFVIIKRDGTLDEQAGLAYANLLLTEQGQRLVKQAGFAPIR